MKRISQEDFLIRVIRGRFRLGLVRLRLRPLGHPWFLNCLI